LVKDKGMTLAGAKKKLKENKDDTKHNFEVIKKLQDIKLLLNELKEYI
jgi:hypothetical protein